MQITETTHPPAGASALLAAVSPEITDLGWLVILHSHLRQNLKPSVEPSAQVLPSNHPALVLPHPRRRFDRQQRPAALPTILVCAPFASKETHRACVGNPPRGGVRYHRADG